MVKSLIEPPALALIALPLLAMSSVMKRSSK